jgi:hypothetical protein
MYHNSNNSGGGNGAHGIGSYGHGWGGGGYRGNRGGYGGNGFHYNGIGEHCQTPTISFGIFFSNDLSISHEMIPIVAGILGSRTATEVKLWQRWYSWGFNRYRAYNNSQQNAGISKQNNYYSSKNRDR